MRSISSYWNKKNDRKTNQEIFLPIINGSHRTDPNGIKIEKLFRFRFFKILIKLSLIQKTRLDICQVE
jgi:hypothetical protein